MIIHPDIHIYLKQNLWNQKSFIKSFDSSDECNFRNNTYSLHRLMLSLPWKGDKRFATAIKPRCQILFWGGWKKPNLGFELPIRVPVSRKTLSIALSFTRIMCVYVFYFIFIVHQYPSWLNITFPSTNLS